MYFLPTLPRAHCCLVHLVQMDTAWEELMAGVGGWRGMEEHGP